MAPSAYAAALQHLSQLVLYGIQPGTDRLAEVLRRLGDPQAAIPAIHIAGTNGKGSTAAYCASLLLQATHALKQRGGARLRIGLYTSPHLQRVRERIKLSADSATELRECTEEEFVRALSAVRAAAESAPAVTLTFFEALTALAFVLWREAGVDLAVVETGLGGRLDATRLCAAKVTVVTSVGFDHMELLGPTLADIAHEKAGIFRPGVPALAACAQPEVRAVLRDEAERVQAPLSFFAPEAPCSIDAAGAAAGAAAAGMPACVPPLAAELAAAVPLAGEHQLRNAALAVAAARLFVDREPGPLHGLLGDPQRVRAGLAATRWPGRLERLWPLAAAASRPVPWSMPSDISVWLDAAHNPEGAAALDHWLAQQLGTRPLTVLFGAVAGKQIRDMTAPLRRARRIVLTRPPSPRGLTAAELTAELSALPAATDPARAAVEPVEDWLAALHTALRNTAPGGLLLVYGSIFLIAAVRAWFYGEQVDVLPVQDPGRSRSEGDLPAPPR